ncbi:NAD(P)H-hydrate dehydratase [Parasediminibacterium sp. JCM 36343]|uniref:NAD(P)H-hydrate dehydratase n=1 Tax=Parasediminibacterium sp. JCM 36343 TaxID=3374279 RepID=UPI0039781A65
MDIDNIPPASWITKEEIAALIKPRKSDSHKGTYGHALLLAGSRGKMGAAVIAARACLRSGVGLLTAVVPEEERAILQIALPEAMIHFRGNKLIDLDKYASIGIGPAFGTDNVSSEALYTILQRYAKPIVIDADAITILSQHKDWWERIPANSIITPHPKEFDRLFGESKSNDERVGKAIQLSKQYPWVIVLKNNFSLVAANGSQYFNNTGNAGLAKGGSGDMLTGMLTALLAQGYKPVDAAIIGVYLHGLAADIAVKQHSMESLLATDVIEKIGEAFKSSLVFHK